MRHFFYISLLISPGRIAYIYDHAKGMCSSSRIPLEYLPDIIDNSTQSDDNFQSQSTQAPASYFEYPRNGLIYDYEISGWDFLLLGNTQGHALYQKWTNPVTGTLCNIR